MSCRRCSLASQTRLPKTTVLVVAPLLPLDKMNQLEGFGQLGLFILRGFVIETKILYFIFQF